MRYSPHQLAYFACKLNGELQENRTIWKFRIVAWEAERKMEQPVEHCTTRFVQAGVGST